MTTASTAPASTWAPGRDRQLGDHAGLGGADGVLELHRLEGEQQVAGGDPLARPRPRPGRPRRASARAASRAARSATGGGEPRHLGQRPPSRRTVHVGDIRRRACTPVACGAPRRRRARPASGATDAQRRTPVRARRPGAPSRSRRVGDLDRSRRRGEGRRSAGPDAHVAPARRASRPTARAARRAAAPASAAARQASRLLVAGQQRREDLRVPVEEAGVGAAGEELGLAQHPDQQVPVGDHAVQLGPGQGAGQRPGRLAPGSAPRRSPWPASGRSGR